MEPEPLATPLRDVLPVLVWAAVGLVVVFVALALARLWGWRTQQRGGSCGGIDLAHLRGQLRAGEISQAEYEAVRARLAGATRTGDEAPDESSADGPAEAPPEEATDEPSEGPAGDPDAEPDEESSIETDGADPPHTGDDAPKRSRTDGET